MNAAGVYSGTAKLLRALEKQSETATEEQEALEADLEPLSSDAEADANMQNEGFYWDDQSQSYIDGDYAHSGTIDLHPDVAAAIDRVSVKHKLVTTH